MRCPLMVFHNKKIRSFVELQCRVTRPVMGPVGIRGVMPDKFFYNSVAFIEGAKSALSEKFGVASSKMFAKCTARTAQTNEALFKHGNGWFALENFLCFFCGDTFKIFGV